MIFKKICFILSGLFFLTNSYADDISLGIPGYGGSGCPSGSASVTLSQDQKSLSILFDEFVVEAGDLFGRMINRKTCNIAIPVHVPNGMSVSIIEVDYRGFNSIPRGGRNIFSVEYFFAGQRNEKFTKTFIGPLESDFNLSNTLGVSGIVWSPCGTDVNLRINSSMLARSNNRGDDTLAMVDSVDMKAGLIYHLAFRRCR